jgi:hypothetical protein
MRRIKALVLALIMLLSVLVINTTSVYATDAKKLLNSAELYPCKTGVVEVDQRVDEILTELRKTNKDTYSLMRAVYTYIVQNTDYGYDKERVSSNITFHKDPLYETAIPRYVTSFAIDTIFDNQGICNSYNSAMIVFARAIGLEAYYYGGETHSASGGFVEHAWCEIKINGTMYIFDPNVDYSIYKANGSIMYLYFCKTEEELKDKYKWYPENDAKYLADFGEVKPESERITPPSYIYDQEEKAAEMPTNLLNSVNDVESAESAVERAVQAALYANNSTTDDHLLLFAEEAIARAGEMETDDDVINIDDSSVSEAMARAKDAATAVEKKVNRVDVKRYLRKKIRVVVKNNETVTINKEKLKKYSDGVTVVTPYGSIELGATDSANITLENKGTNKIKVNFSDNKTASKVTVSFPNISSDGYRAVINEKGEVIGGKLNPITKEFSAKIDASGIYTLANNEKSFDDIKDKSSEMQQAIKLLASKGIINGTSTKEFSPDSSITRAEVAAIVLRMMDKLDANADGGFSDVDKMDWYFGVAGSAKKNGVISGYQDNTFRGKTIIPKVQIVSVMSRVLKEEMNYKNLDDAQEILTKNYIDSTDIAQWAVNDVALATYANMVIGRNDYKFAGNDEMKRGDAAIMLKRLYDKVW